MGVPPPLGAILTLSFFIEGGSGIDDPPPILDRIAEPREGVGEAGTSSSTVI